MYSYKGQGSPAVVSYQYGTERYVRDDKYNGLDIQTFDPRPQVHSQPQNNPMLHRQNIQKSGMMPMQRGQANLFPVDGKGQSYASSNLDSYSIVDKHSSVNGFSSLASMDYLRDTDDDQKQVYMQTRLQQFQDYKVRNYYYRIFENGLIQILSPSPSMKGRIISLSKRPQLYKAIVKSIQETYRKEDTSLLSGVTDWIKENVVDKAKDRRKERKQDRKDEKDRKERSTWWEDPRLSYYLKLPRDKQLELYLALGEQRRALVQGKLMLTGQRELLQYLSNPFRSVSTTPTQISNTSVPTSTSPFAKEEKGINKVLLISGILGGGFLLYKFVLKK